MATVTHSLWLQNVLICACIVKFYQVCSFPHSQETNQTMDNKDKRKAKEHESSDLDLLDTVYSHPRIRKATPNINLDSGLFLPTVWNPILPTTPPSPPPHHHVAPFCLVNACHSLFWPLILCLFGKHCMLLQFTLANQSPVTYLDQSQIHVQSRSTIGQCLLYSLSHTAVSLVLYAVVKGLRGRIVLHQLLLILLCICSQSVHQILAT